MLMAMSQQVREQKKILMEVLRAGDSLVWEWKLQYQYEKGNRNEK